VTRFTVLPNSSSVSTLMRSSVHDLHAETRTLAGTIDGELDNDGTPRFEAAHGARLQVPVGSMRSGNRLQDMEMQRRLDPRRHPYIEVVVDRAWQLDGSDGYRAAFRVSAHGRTHAFEENFRMRLEGRRLIVEGEHAFDMRDFDVSPPRFLTLKVDPAVTVRARIVADREES
jgi:YceI-like domain